MMKRIKRDITVVDRITDMPDHIKHDILSRLNTRSAVQTSVLSKSWRHEWSWLPCLNFDRHLLPRNLLLEDLGRVSLIKKSGKQEIFGKKEAFLNFLDQALLRRSCKGLSYILQKLTLYVPATHVEISSHVDQWLACAMECGVRKLHLHISSAGGNHACYQLPESTLHAGFLTSLKLFNCKITSIYPYMIKLSSLQKLTLSMVHVDERTLRWVIICCRALKKLNLMYCFGFDELKVSGAPELEKVKVSTLGLKRVVFEALQLQAFVFEGSIFPVRVNVATCKNIRYLKLSEVDMTDDEFSSHVSELHFLEDLHMINCNSLRSVKISAPTLKNLCVKYCGSLSKVDINAPNLESFTYWADNMLSLTLNVSSLACANVKLKYQKTDALWLARFIKFLKKFNCSTALTLCITPNISVFIPVKLRRIFHSPLLNVEHMKVQMNFPTEAHSLADIVDTVLWLSPHPDYITVFPLFLDCKVMKFHFMYEEQSDTGTEATCSCCSSIPIKCWRHCLKEVKIENLTSVKDAAKLKALFENSEKLERIEGIPL